MGVTPAMVESHASIAYPVQNFSYEPANREQKRGKESKRERKRGRERQPGREIVKRPEARRNEPSSSVATPAFFRDEANFSSG